MQQLNPFMPQLIEHIDELIVHIGKFNPLFRLFFSSPKSNPLSFMQIIPSRFRVNVILSADILIPELDYLCPNLEYLVPHLPTVLPYPLNNSMDGAEERRDAKKRE